MKMKTIKDANEIVLPETFTCPICVGKIVISEITEWEETDDGSWQVSDTGLYINCEHEPEIGSDDWHGWMNGHWSMPYVDWLPVTERVLSWINKNYRFEIQAST